MKRRDFIKGSLAVGALSYLPSVPESAYVAPTAHVAPTVRSRMQGFTASPRNKAFAEVGGIRLEPGAQMIGCFVGEVPILLGHRDDVVSAVYFEQ